MFFSKNGAQQVYSERELIERIQNGDPQARKELVDRYLPRVIKLVEIRVGREMDQFDDIVHDAIVAIFDSIEKTFDINKSGSLGAYIYGITSNKIKDFFRDSKREAQFHQDAAVDHLISETNAELMLEREEFQRKLKNEISKLKEKYRIVLYLRFYEDLSIQQIAEKIGLPPRRVSERIHYALKLLKNNMQRK